MTTLEMMAIHWATKKFNVYLQGLPHFHIEKDQIRLGNCKYHQQENFGRN
uniref:Reverse transcriptase RNase H-like domain-containing protein n=1 Tax=Lepeophtheirus salmonis TaxID=72036 RepID=A0A0K2UKL0_LEPSM